MYIRSHANRVISVNRRRLHVNIAIAINLQRHIQNPAKHLRQRVL